MPQVPEMNDIVLDLSEIAGFDGVEVRCKSVSMKRAQKMGEQWADAENGGFERMNREFVEQIVVSWNLTLADGEPLPKTLEAVEEQIPWLLQTLRMAWNRGLLTPPKA